MERIILPFRSLRATPGATFDVPSKVRAKSSTMCAAICATLVAAPLFATADGAVASHTPATASYIFVGFAGGFVRHDDVLHGPVRLARKIQQDIPKGASVQVFENRHRKDAYRSILRLLDTNHDGVVSNLEKAQAHIIPFGHSWGACCGDAVARVGA